MFYAAPFCLYVCLFVCLLEHLVYWWLAQKDTIHAAEFYKE